MLAPTPDFQGSCCKQSEVIELKRKLGKFSYCPVSLVRFSPVVDYFVRNDLRLVVADKEGCSVVMAKGLLMGRP